MATLLEKLMPSMSFARFLAVLAIAATFIWFGILNVQGTGALIAKQWIESHSFLSAIPENIKGLVPLILGSIQLLIGIIVALHAVPGRFKQQAYMVVVALSLGALSLLVTNPVWIKGLGGFPAIGSGQGIIKYTVMAGLALWLGASRHANTVMLLGLILVLGWIGAMKFTGPEAEGVYPLLTTSPVFNWWAPVYFDKQTASNIIGIIELITVVCLTGWWWNKHVCRIGLVLSACTFVVTLSFLASFSGAWNPVFPYLSSAGHFLLKDLALLAATIALMAETKLRP